MASSYSQLLHGQLAVTGTAQQLTATQDDIGAVIVKAHDANSIKVYVGTSTVTTSTGFELGAGQAVTVDLNALGTVYVVASTTGATVSWLAVSPA